VAKNCLLTEPILKTVAVFEDGCRIRGDLALDVGEAITLGLDDLTVPDHDQGQARKTTFAEARLDVIVNAIRARRGRREERQNQARDGEQSTLHGGIMQETLTPAIRLRGEASAGQVGLEPMTC